MLLMIRPAAFTMNTQTAVNNYFQNTSIGQHPDIHSKALEEFDAMVAALQQAHVEVVVVQDTADPHTPDSIFPNNWVSYHGKGYVLYPMFAENRRLEKALDIWSALPKVECLFDLSGEEKRDLFLEGTGSLVLDRDHAVAYAALSPRTSQELVERWCEKMEYKPVIVEAFHTVGEKRLPIYHTNVMMSVGNTFALWCPSCIDHLSERKHMEQSLQIGNREIIEISESQMQMFGANILQVFNRIGDSYILMSATAEKALEGTALTALRRHGKILSCPIPTIEQYGGGSARCMVAEVLLD